MTKNLLRWLIPFGIAIMIAMVLFLASAYMLDETEQAVITQFGKHAHTEFDPGLHFKTPFIQEIRRFDNRIMAWDGDPEQIPTRGRQFISVDATARWRIVDPLLYLQSVKNEAGAQSRLDDIMDSAVRDEISSSNLVEIVRSRDWKVGEGELNRTGLGEKERELLQKTIQLGREQLERNILAIGQKGLGKKFGIELLDVRIKRLNYVRSVREEVFLRMISERQRIAEQFRAEGLGRSEAIQGQTEKDVAVIRSEAQRKAEVIRGEADATATRVYNKAYSVDPEFFAFYRTLESYSQSIGKGATLFLSADSEYLTYLKRSAPPATTP